MYFVFCIFPDIVSPNHVGWLHENWWRDPDDSIDCTPAELDEAVADYLGVYSDNFPSDEGRTPTISGLVRTNYKEREKKNV